MKHLAKRTLSLLLAALMVLTIIPAQPLHAHADDNTNVASVVASGVSDPAKQTCTNASIGSKYKGVSLPSSYQIIRLNGTNAYFTICLSADFLNGFTSGKAYIDVEYYTAYNAPDTVKYTSGSTVKSATKRQTLSGTRSDTTIARYTVTDASFTEGVISGVGGVLVGTTSAEVRIFSVTITKTEVFEPEFNSSDFTSSRYLYDGLTPNLTVTNNNAEKMYITANLKLKDSANNELYSTDITDKEVPANEEATLGQAATILAKTKSNGKYKIVVDGTYKVGNSTPTNFSKTIEFDRQATFYQRLQLDDNGALWYVPTKRTGVDDDLRPDKFEITITNEENELVVSKAIVNTPDENGNTTFWDPVNLTAEIQAKKTQLEQGDIVNGETYMVSVTAYKGTQKRIEIKDKTYIYGDVPELPATYTPVFYDTRNPSDIKIKNNGAEKEVEVKATITLDGTTIATDYPMLNATLKAAGTKETDPETGTEKALDIAVAVPALQLGTVMKDASGKYVNGKYVLTLNVQWGDVEYVKSYTMTREDAIDADLRMQDGKLYYDVALKSGADNWAPDSFVVSFADAEGNALTFTDAEDKPVNMNLAVDFTQNRRASFNLSELYGQYLPDYGTYNVAVKAYKGEVPKVTDTYQYVYTDMVPTFNSNTFLRLLDEEVATATLEMSNPSATKEMTYSLKLTLTRNGSVVLEATVPTNGPVSVPGGDKATIAPPSSYYNYVGTNGKYQITVDGTITIDEIEYPVYHTFGFERRETFTHKFEESSSGALQFGVQKVAGGEKYAPNKFAIEVIRKATAEGENDVVVYSKDATSLPYDTDHDLTNLMNENNVVDGKYDVVIKAYAGEVLRKTITHTDYYKCTIHTPKDAVDCQTATTCANCGRAIKGNHKDTNEDGKCDVVVSGEGETAVVCDMICAHKGAYVALNGTMDYNILIPEGAETAVVRSDGKKLGNVTIDDNNGTPVIIVPGLAAKELCETFFVELYDAEGKKIGELTESFAAYATRVFNDQNKKDSWNLIADMIVYIAEAQKHFKFKTEKLMTDLVDVNLYDAHKTQNQIECENQLTEKPAAYYGTSFVLEKNIVMKMYVKGATYCTYKIKNGETVIESGECEGVKNNAYYGFSFNEFVTKYGHKDVTVTATFYKDNTKTEMVTEVTDSMASYVARAKAGGESEIFLDAMMKYVTAAWNYLASK